LVGSAIVAERYIKVAILEDIALIARFKTDRALHFQKKVQSQSCWTVFAGISLVLADFVVGCLAGLRPFIEEAISVVQQLS